MIIDEAVAIQHYSSSNLYIGTLLEKAGNIMSIKIQHKINSIQFNEGDPVACGMITHIGEIDISSCIISKMNIDGNILEISVNKKGIDYNRRFYERFPVSLYANVGLSHTNNKYPAIVKDISVIGMQIHSKSDFQANQELDIDLNMGTNILSIKSFVIRKLIDENNFIYGLSISNCDTRTKRLIEEYLQNMEYVYKNFLKSL